MQKEDAFPEVDAPKEKTMRAAPFLVDYLWKNKSNRIWWIVSLGAFLLQYICFKVKYPFANYMPDSYSYIEAAAANLDVNMWPVAYSKFLRLISVFTHSDKIVVGLQYFAIQISSLIFLFSLLYFARPGKTVKSILLAFVLLNPVPLYIANYISADALFISASLLWLSSLIWIIYEPKPGIIIVHGFLLLACFTLRYNSIYYPLLSAAALLVSRQSWKRKVGGVAWGLALISMSYVFTSHKMQEVTGKYEYSAFGGWQLANNALYMYEHLPVDQRPAVPARFAKLDSMVRQHMDTLTKVKLTAEDSATTYFYLWNPKGPLIQYLVRDYKKDSTTPYFKRWSKEGDLYRDYALFLMKKFPAAYARYFMLPNARKYVAPPQEFLGTYNMNADSVGAIAKDWFNYKSQKVQDHKKEPKIMLVVWYPIFSAVTQIILLMGVFSLLLLNAVKWKEYGLPQVLILVLLFWAANCTFSVFASPIVLRYQAFPILIFFAISTLLIERIVKMAFAKS